MNHKTISIFLGALALTLTAFLLTPSLAIGEVGDLPVRGWAWSSNVGWISLHTPQDDEDGYQPGAPAYGVSKTADGSLVGHAWNNNIGWIKFGGLSDFPSGPGTSASNAKISGDQVIGWARALTGAAGASQGWDGWISLSGTGYGVHHANGVLSSNSSGDNRKAWGPMLGWIGFDATIDDGEKATLNVKSNLVTGGVTISADPTSTPVDSGGTTGYTIKHASPISAILTAPETADRDRNFLNWQDCDSENNRARKCTVAVALGETQTVTANYEEDEPLPEELSIQCFDVSGDLGGSGNVTVNVGAKATDGVPTYTFRWYEPNLSGDLKGYTSGINPDQATSLERTYSAVGIYPGAIKVTDDGGNTDSCDYEVTVEDDGGGPEEGTLSVGNGNMIIDTQVPGEYSDWSTLATVQASGGSVEDISITGVPSAWTSFFTDPNNKPKCVARVDFNNYQNMGNCEGYSLPNLSDGQTLYLGIIVPEPTSRAGLRGASPMAITIGNGVIENVEVNLSYRATDRDIN